MPQLVRDYYTVKVPGDMEDTVDKLAEVAINMADDRTKLYFIPATWTARLVAGEVGDFEVTFRVCRIRNRRVKTS